MDGEVRRHACEMVREAAQAVAASANEATLRHQLEKILEHHCRALGIPWVTFQLDQSLGSPNGSVRFVDVAHGAVVIEYEAPGRFGGHSGGELAHARSQAEEYGRQLRAQEGRPLGEYVLVVWDGRHISFGRFVDDMACWDPLTPFDVDAALQLLLYLRENGVPLVHPDLLCQLVGPDSAVGSRLIPLFFDSVRQAVSASTSSKTKLLFLEWKRLFGQVAGVQSERLKVLLAQQERAHGKPYAEDPAAYLFALNTYIALVAKLVAAMSLPNGSEDLRDPNMSLAEKVRAVESGELFRDAGVSNMLVGDFFSWYRDDVGWEGFAGPIGELIATLGTVNFDVAKKDPNTTRDLFKGMYQTFVPKALRHALGEYYTPDWLAAHALDVLGWKPEDSLLDPTCGSGTFILEGLRRRLAVGRFKDARDLLSGLYGIDLNPLAVITARASLVVFISRWLDPAKPVRLPVFLADAINTASASGLVFKHRLQTERGVFSFTFPRTLAARGELHEMMGRVRDLMEEGYTADGIYEVLLSEFRLESLKKEESEALRNCIDTLVRLQKLGWNGIWAMLLADRFAAATIPPVKFIAGNPPWVKWSHLPPEYAAFIKDRCIELGVFSRDRWVGGIESDISTVITYEAIDKWLAPCGKMAFFITGTVFQNESSEGFRRWCVKHRGLEVRVLCVHDFDAVSPFEGVSNHPTLLILKRDGKTTYPVPYRVWEPPRIDGRPVRTFADACEFRERASCKELLAYPVPGTDAGPWLKGTDEDHKLWRLLFGPSRLSYRARKGVTTDCNGVFFVRVLGVSPDGNKCRIRNNPTLGRKSGIPTHTGWVEAEHVFPLLRGRGVRAFVAAPDPEYRILLPQRAMHGDARLPIRAPGAHRFLRRFKKALEERSSYRRFQAKGPYWSVWSTGSYTFSKYKVLWKEMSGGQFVAAYCGMHADPHLGKKVIIPDHKLYFIPAKSEREAAYLTAVLNSPSVSRAISAYAAQLSLGISVVEYLNIPRYNRQSRLHRQLASLAKQISVRGGNPTKMELGALDSLALRAFRANALVQRLRREGWVGSLRQRKRLR